MKELVHQIQEAVAHSVQARYGLALSPAEVVVQTTSKDHTGDYTVVIFGLMKHKLGTLPEIGEALGQDLCLLPDFDSYELVKGFLNLTVSNAYWLQLLGYMRTQGAAYYSLPPRTETAVVEYASPNTNKPLHLGHLRNNFLGAAVTQLLKTAGYPTHTVCLFNDKGIHVCKSMLAWQRFGNGETPETSGTKGDHLVGKYYVRFDQELQKEVAELEKGGMDKEQAKKEAPIQKAAQEMYRRWEAGDAEVIALWKQMNGWVYAGMEQTFGRMGVRFDKYYYESETYLLGKQVVEEGLEKGLFYRNDDGSVWVDLTDIGLDQKLLLRSDGTSLYMTQDLGTADLRYQDYHMQQSLYVIGNEQDYHMKVLKEVLLRLGRPYAPGMYHLSYGMVDLPTGKMKSREGTVVDADELMDEMVTTAREATQELGKTEGMDPAGLELLYEQLALGALKYFLLKVDPQKRMLFNPQESIDFKGHTGTFIQYTHARIHGILRKAEQDNPGILQQPADYPDYTLHPLERALLHRLQAYRTLLAEAARTYNPALIANYVYELSKDYSRFHYEVPVLRAENATAMRLRVHLNALVAGMIAQCMHLLGIQVPQRM